MTIDLKTVDIKPLRQTYAHVARHIGGDKAASRYQEGTFGAQPEANFHYRPTWDPDHALFDASRTAIRLDDWYALKDPRQFYYATWTMARARQQDAMESNFDFVESRGLAAAIPDAQRDRALAVLVPLRHAAWGANMNNAQVCATGYGTAFTAPAMFHAMDHLGIAQYITRLALTLAGPDALDAGKQAWLDAPAWQPLRQYVEDTFVLDDPVELFVAQNLALDGLLYPLVYGRFVDDDLTMQGAGSVAMLTRFMPEWHAETARWIDSVVKTMGAASEDNKALLVHWIAQWEKRAAEVLRPVAALALGAECDATLEEVRGELAARLAKAGLTR